jgi:3-dehydroquinate synthetase/shikimate kinase
VGPTGAGKTSVGRALARKLRRPFVDADDLVAARAGMTVEEVFRNLGEPAFRRLERRAVSDVLRLGDVVAGLGGGALLDGGVRQRVARDGCVIVLDADLATLGRRLRENPPAVLGPAGVQSDEEISRLIAVRRESCQGLGPVIDTTGRTPEEAADAAARALGADGGRLPELKTWELRLDVGAAASTILVRPLALAGGVTSGWLPAAGDAWPGRAAVVASPVTWAMFGRLLLDELTRGGWKVVDVSIVPDGESAKTPTCLARLWRAWAAARVERGDGVIALGGGALTDVAGLAAATYLRGLRWLSVPTTLLAQCDAAVGGKVAVNLAAGKNLVGAFHQPMAVVVDPVVSARLPRPRRAEGLAEVVKCAVIGGGKLWRLVMTRAPHLIDGDVAALDAVLRGCLQLKVDIVGQDERESGPREVLNLGHTVGHAIEAAARWPHGRAVAVGLVAACRLTAALGGDEGMFAQVEEVFSGFGLPTRVSPALAAAIVDRVAHDKKVRGGQLRFVLPHAPGAVRTGVVVKKQTLCAVLRDMRA